MYFLGVQQYANDECIFVLLGNKTDLKDTREVTEKEAQKYGESIGAKYFEICSTTREGMHLNYNILSVLASIKHLKSFKLPYHELFSVDDMNGKFLCYCRC